MTLDSNKDINYQETYLAINDNKINPFNTSTGQTIASIMAVLKNIGYLAYDDVSTTGYVYFGYAIPGTSQSAAAWIIEKASTSAGQSTWAAVLNGVPDNSQIWNNRTALTYS